MNLIISIHAPRMGSDNATGRIETGGQLFQSTLPAWGATFYWFLWFGMTTDFNPRSPQGSDNRPPYYALYYIIFQPTLSAWGATVR